MLSFVAIALLSACTDTIGCGEWPTCSDEFWISADASQIRVELDAGAHVNERTENYATALHRAGLFRNLEMIEALSDLGADIEARDDNGQTSLNQAVLLGDNDVVEVLLARGADIEARNHLNP